MAETTQKATTYSSSAAPAPREAQAQKPKARARKMTDYGRQLAEKQKARREYGLREGQFSRYFKQAASSSVATGQALFTSLERRLDNVVFRSGIAKTRRMARQLVGHGLILVNDKRISIPGYNVQAGDTIRLKKPETFEYNKEAILPSWINYNAKTQTATVERLPKAEDVVTDINDQLIVEFYSR